MTSINGPKHIDRFVDDEDDYAKEQLNEQASDIHNFYADFEAENVTAREKELVQTAQEYVRDFASHYRDDLSDKKLDTDNIIIAEKGSVSSYVATESEAMYLLPGSTVLVEKDESEARLFEKTTHELLHHYAYKAVQKTIPKNKWEELKRYLTEPESDVYRSGIEAHSRDGEIAYFRMLHEGTVDLITNYLLHKASEEGLLDKLDRNNSGRIHERTVIEAIARSIHVQNEDKFKDEDEVLRLFVKAHFDGNLLSIARLCEETFGKGSFRELGKLTRKENIYDIYFDDGFVERLNEIIMPDELT